MIRRHTQPVLVQLIGILLCASLQLAAAQSANPAASPAVNIDPSLLAKANAGDPGAEVRWVSSMRTPGPPSTSAAWATQDYQRAAAWYRKAAEPEIH